MYQSGDFSKNTESFFKTENIKLRIRESPNY